jgi:DNA-binding NtrC family response regulator
MRSIPPARSFTRKMQFREAQPASRPRSDKLVTQEKEMIEAALAANRGRVSGPLGAAAKLVIPPSTLESKIRSLKINKHCFKST